jgi:hypothetical protein
VLSTVFVGPAAAAARVGMNILDNVGQGTFDDGILVFESDGVGILGISSAAMACSRRSRSPTPATA